ncbi:MAG: type II secretion system GspH family protein [Clostridiales bacterium]|jgi:prepilin-type N-terminal cleavage/methylation domain-containing protein|nr:type II secretion system GspH family protein [Clostridiales bacterium]
MNIKKLFAAKKGFTLVEMVIVLVVFGMLIAGAFSFFLFAIKSTQDISETSHAQSELRNMLLYIQSEARTAKKVMITDGLPSLQKFEDNWELGTLIFYERNTGGKKTLSVLKYDTPSGGSPTLKLTAVKEFDYIDNFEVLFTTSALANTEDLDTDSDSDSDSDTDTDSDADKEMQGDYVMTVILNVESNGHIMDTVLRDSFYLSNLKANSEKLKCEDIYGNEIEEGKFLILTPAVIFEDMSSESE